MGIAEFKMREKIRQIDAICAEVMNEDFPKLIKGKKLQIQEELGSCIWIIKQINKLHKGTVY